MAAFNIDDDLIRRLASLLDETGLNEIEFSEGERSLRVAKGGGQTVQHLPVAPPPAAAAAPAAGAESGSNAQSMEGAVTSPMVGTAYLSPEPGAPAFVKTGDVVSEGQTLMIIEAMKVMNPIKAPRAGTVRAILVEDAQPVEFGEALLVVA